MNKKQIKTYIYTFSKSCLHDHKIMKKSTNADCVFVCMNSSLTPVTRVSLTPVIRDDPVHQQGDDFEGDDFASVSFCESEPNIPSW